MSKKNYAHRIVALIAIVMLSLAPVTFAADGSSPISLFDSIVKMITETLDEAIGDDDGARSADGDDGQEEDEPAPDFDPMADPVG